MKNIMFLIDTRKNTLDEEELFSKINSYFITHNFFLDYQPKFIIDSYQNSVFYSPDEYKIGKKKDLFEYGLRICKKEIIKYFYSLIPDRFSIKKNLLNLKWKTNEDLKLMIQSTVPQVIASMTLNHGLYGDPFPIALIKSYYLFLESSDLFTFKTIKLNGSSVMNYPAIRLFEENKKKSDHLSLVFLELKDS